MKRTKHSDDEEEWLPSSPKDKERFHKMLTRSANKRSPKITAVQDIMKEPVPPIVYTNILPLPFPVNTLQDLINLAKLKLPEGEVYIDCQKLPPLLQPLEELSKMEGIEYVKQSVCDNVLFFLQCPENQQPKMSHTIITGNSGVGKTTLANILAKLSVAMGKLSTDRVVKATRKDLIADHIGGTAKRTQKKIDSALGGCLLIDEAYALGTGGHDGDSFSVECLDVINQNMTEKGEQFQLIMAGYKNALEENVFSLNQGLARRFAWRFDLPDANPRQLAGMFMRMTADQGLVFEESVTLDVVQKWFEEHMIAFPHSGGSVQNFVDKVKIAHYRRAFGQTTVTKGKLSLKDLEAGYILHKSTEINDEQKKADDRYKFIMYN